jgi:hypothetical protein
MLRIRRVARLLALLLLSLAACGFTPAAERLKKLGE